MTAENTNGYSKPDMPYIPETNEREQYDLQQEIMETQCDNYGF